MYVHLYRAMRLLLAGEYDDVEAVSAEMLRLGERVQDTNALQAHVLQMVALRRARGGLEGLEALVRHQAERFVAIPGWLCVLAHVHAETGRPEEAKATLDEFARDDFRALPLDGIWLGAIAMLAEIAVAVDDPAHAGALYALLEPYADRNVPLGWAATCAGSASRHLGLLAGLLGRRDDAVRHFERALAMNERMGARGWTARTRVEFARLLLQSRFQRARAATMLDEGLSEARALGMPALVALGDPLTVRA
jgi:tetratricopeptide (TPR) repeat protein